ncbi:MAG: helix-turn-helix domain-containing protein [Mycobacteriales bacterium]
MKLTVTEAARRTGRHPETIRRWIRSGRLRASKVGTQHVIDELDLDAVTVDEDHAPAGLDERPDAGRPAAAQLGAHRPRLAELALTTSLPVRDRRRAAPAWGRPTGIRGESGRARAAVVSPLGQAASRAPVLRT